MPEPATLPRHLATLAIAGLLAAACGGSGDNGTDVPPPPESAPVAEPASPPTNPAPAGTSAVAGTVVFEGKAPRLKPIRMDADPDCVAKHDGTVAAQTLVLGDDQSLANVFVQVKNPPAGTHPPPAEPVVVDQRGCLYVPRVLGVMAGQVVRFRNSDGMLHNVHGLPEKNREFNLGMPGSVTELDHELTRPEPVFPVKCDVHPWMRSFVAVMSHPYFAVTDTSGGFSIEGLPAGTWELEAWHEKLGVASTRITVGEGETGTVNFTFAAPSGT